MSDPYEEYEELKQVLYQVRTELATAREAFNRADALNIKLQSREWAVREELSTTRAELERTRQELVRCGVEARRLVAIEVDNLRENLSIAQQKSDNLRAERDALRADYDKVNEYLIQSQKRCDAAREELAQCAKERDEAILAECPNLLEQKPAPRCPKCGSEWITVEPRTAGQGFQLTCDECGYEAGGQGTLDAALDAWRGGAK